MTGEFFSLPEGAIQIFNGVPLGISYVGGTGNDVTLTALAPLIPAQQTPTLSEWALMLLASSLAAMAAGRLRRR